MVLENVAPACDCWLGRSRPVFVVTTKERLLVTLNTLNGLGMELRGHPDTLLHHTLSPSLDRLQLYEATFLLRIVQYKLCLELGHEINIFSDKVKY